MKEMTGKDRLMEAMIAYDRGDPKRIQHFIKVHAFARMIGRREGLEGRELETLLAAAIVHDIGIRVCEEKYGSCEGKLQEKEGPAIAEKMMGELGFDREMTERVAFLVGHHHTYRDIEGMDYQILVEADFLVNLFEDNASHEAVVSAYHKIFKTHHGKQICETMFGLSPQKDL